jgi:hypothetical protein
MILPFSTHFKDGSDTNFIRKIWAGLINIDDADEILERINLRLAYIRDSEGTDHPVRPFFPSSDLELEGIAPKLHTMREDKKDRWHTGSKIHMVVFNRTKNQFQFAPIIDCISTQVVEIINRKDYSFVSVGNHCLFEMDTHTVSITPEFVQLVNNDGFESIDEFFNWFDHDFKGKIIHWTDLKY